jgi:hypothetical protein
MEQFRQWAAKTIDAGWSLMTTDPSLFIAVFSVGFLIGALVVGMLLHDRIQVHRALARYYKLRLDRVSAPQINEPVTRSVAEPVSPLERDKPIEKREIQETPATIAGSPSPKEVFRGQPLGPKDLERIRLELETLDSIKVADEELRGLVKRNWPHLVVKLPPRVGDQPAKSRNDSLADHLPLSSA